MCKKTKLKDFKEVTFEAKDLTDIKNKGYNVYLEKVISPGKKKGKKKC